MNHPLNPPHHPPLNPLQAQPLVINGISKAYGAQQVVSDVSLTLNKGEIFGLIGLNGVGKTTLIKIILQLASADSGTVSLFGTSANQVAARQNLAYLPEKFQPSKYLTGLEYIRLCLDYYGLKLVEEEAIEAATALQLDPAKLNKKISSYSKGMGQKIGLIGALLSQRPLLILDEPMSGLDPMARIHLKQRLMAYKEAGNSLFFTSHILSDIDELCDRIGVIHNGTLLFVGSPAEFKQKFPAENLERTFLNAIAA